MLIVIITGRAQIHQADTNIKLPNNKKRKYFKKCGVAKVVGNGLLTVLI